MTVLRSSLLAREGFEHGFGTSRTAQEDYPVDVHILLQVHGERVVVLTGGHRAQGAGRSESRAGREKPKEFGILNPQSGIGGGDLDINDLEEEKRRRGEKETNSRISCSDTSSPSPLFPFSGAEVICRSLPADHFRFDEGDAMVSDIPGVSMGIRTADCLPVLIADRLKGTAAAVHCGWRSTSLGLAGKAVRVMTEVMGSPPQNLLAAIGPSIGPCCYEVGEEVREAFSHFKSQEGLFEEKDQKLCLDLASGVKTQLIMEGVSPENIDEIVGCTSCNPDLFWSHRARKDEGRMVSFITVREAYE